MRERASSNGGRLTTSSDDGRFVVEAWLPAAPAFAESSGSECPRGPRRRSGADSRRVQGDHRLRTGPRGRGRGRRWRPRARRDPRGARRRRHDGHSDARTRRHRDHEGDRRRRRPCRGPGHRAHDVRARRLRGRRDGGWRQRLPRQGGRACRAPRRDSCGRRRRCVAHAQCDSGPARVPRG